MRTRPKAEEIFYNTLITLIKNQLINDPNFETYWYEKNNMMHYSLFKSKAEYILQEIENLKHLIIWDEDEK